MLRTYEGTIQQGRIRLPAGIPLPDGARVLVTVIPAIDEHGARRAANRWLAEQVGDMVMADHGLLDHSGVRSVWRFGAYVTALSREPFGPVGYVEVDAETGAVLANETVAEEIAQRGERLECAPFPPNN